LFPYLYAILDASPNLPSESVAAIAEQLAEAGVQLIQLRAKHASARSLFEMSSRLVSHLNGCGVHIIVNDRPDIASMAGAAGVHVGQEDLAVEAARKICPRPLWVGVSTHNLEQLQAADRTSADYIAVGPIFATGSKENPDPVVGIDFLRAARRITQKTLVAIGGITVESASEVYRAGADSIAVIRDLMAAHSLAQRVREYLTIAESVRGAHE
jgi:thiamine-phosphate pyrophosphorylase